MRDELWELFCDTGEPMCWLMYKQAERIPDEEHRAEIDNTIPRAQ